jgi:hypothetical protein
MDPPLSVEELVREFDEPNLIGWKPFSQSPGVIVYRRLNDVCFNYNMTSKHIFFFVRN